MNLLTLQNLTVKRGTCPVIDNVSPGLRVTVDAE
mgnify:CR=1 FL=1